MIYFLKNAKQRVKKAFQKKAIVLCYHRIADLSIDPWHLAVSPKNFDEQLQVLQKANVISVNELAEQLALQSLSENSICLSFDDGYSDNFYAAKPFLEKYNIPASFFIAASFIDGTESFWWDDLQYIFLGAHSLPRHLSVVIESSNLSYDLGDDAEFSDKQYTLHQTWTWEKEPPTKRCKVFLDLWAVMKPLSFLKIEAMMNVIREWSQLPFGERDDRPMTSQELSQLANNPLFQIGIHTMTHPALANHSFQTQFEEIVESRKKLSELCNKTTDTIAYPYGNYSKITIDVVRQLELKLAFTTEERLITVSDNKYQLGRFQVKNWNGEQFEKALHNWKRQF